MRFSFFLLFVPLSCSLPELNPQPQHQKSISLKVVGYNLWHGLTFDGPIAMKSLHPKEYRKTRFSTQLKLFKQEQPDILFLQELNPVFSQSKKIAKELGYSYAFQETNCGMSLLGFNLPLNLNIGISIFVKPPLKIEKILGLKLSGTAGFCNPYASFQLSEFRYALFALIYHPEYGDFLAVNTHLHHTSEEDESLQKQVEVWKEKKVLTSQQAEKLKKSFREGNKRREEELKNVLHEIEELQNHYGNLPLILGGDFNLTVRSPAYQKILQEGLKDSAGNNQPLPYTWDPLVNQKNHEYNKGFKGPVNHFKKTEVKDFLEKKSATQRRIDYLFVNSKIHILSHSLFANQANAEGVIPSDHFGVLVNMNILAEK